VLDLRRCQQAQQIKVEDTL